MYIPCVIVHVNKNLKNIEAGCYHQRRREEEGEEREEPSFTAQPHANGKILFTLVNHLSKKTSHPPAATASTPPFPPATIDIQPFYL